MSKTQTRLYLTTVLIYCYVLYYKTVLYEFYIINGDTSIVQGPIRYTKCSDVRMFGSGNLPVITDDAPSESASDGV